MKIIRKMKLWLGIVPLGLVLDQVSKIMVKKYLVNPVVIIDDWFGFYYTENTGAAWSVLADKTWLLALISFVACAIIAFFYFRYDKLSRWVKCGLVLVFTGALGNGIDRLFRGYVIDFIQLNFFKLFGGIFPIFNIADIFVTIGAIVLIIGLIFFDNEGRKHE